MMRLVAALALLLLPAAAYAQPKQVVATCGSGVTLGVGDGSNGTIDTAGRECAASTSTITPTGIVGFGSLALTNASTALSTLTIGPGSGAWATTGYVDVTNDSASAGTMYVCPFGGVCTSANGIPVLVGQSFRFSKPATTMTLISASTSTVYAQF